LPEEDRLAFVVLNRGLGNVRVSQNLRPGSVSHRALQALLHDWTGPVTLREVLQSAGAEIAEDPEDADIDLSLENLGKDTLTALVMGELQS